MTLNDFLRRIKEPDSRIKDRVIIFRDDKGAWDNVTAKVVGESIEISYDHGRPFGDCPPTAGDNTSNPLRNETV